MLLELIREGTNDETGAIRGALYVDGDFYGYTLENSSYAIAPGEYALSTRFSPKLVSNKIEIIVPGRSYLMFHGGNTPEDSTGCVLLASKRIDDSTIQGDVSNALYLKCKDEANAGTAKLVIKEPSTINTGGFLAVLALATIAGFYIIK